MNRSNVSYGDIKVLQILSWFFSILGLIPMLIFLAFDFSTIALFISFLALTFILIAQYFNSKAWNIRFEGDGVVFENIYEIHKRDLNLFKVIRKTGFIGNYYTFYLKDGESFYFRINPINDLKLFFKNDSQFYVNKMNKEVKDYIKIQKGQVLLD